MLALAEIALAEIDVNACTAIAMNIWIGPKPAIAFGKTLTAPWTLYFDPDVIKRRRHRTRMTRLLHESMSSESTQPVMGAGLAGN